MRAAVKYGYRTCVSGAMDIPTSGVRGSPGALLVWSAQRAHREPLSINELRDESPHGWGEISGKNPEIFRRHLAKSACVE
jgi:hypothetical protein